MTLQAQAQQRLTALKADLTKLNEETNTVLSGLADVCTQFTELLQELPKQWLLSAADLSSYQQQDVEARKVIQRCVILLFKCVNLLSLVCFHAVLPVPQVSASSAGHAQVSSCNDLTQVQTVHWPVHNCLGCLSAAEP